MAIQEFLTKREGSTGYDYELDETGDIKLVSESEEVALLLTQRLQTFKGEWRFDLKAGVPYFEEVFTKPAVKQVIDSIIKTEILQTPGVKALLDYESILDMSARTITINFRYTDIYTSDETELSVSPL